VEDEIENDTDYHDDKDIPPARLIQKNQAGDPTDRICQGVICLDSMADVVEEDVTHDGHLE